MTRRTLVFALALSGCHGQIPAASVSAAGHGTLRDSSGSAAGAGIAVTLTDGNTGETFPPVYTDKAGQFAFSHSPGKYAVAITSSSQFAFIESAELPGAPVILSTNCHRVSGQVTGTPIAPTVLTFSRLSRNIGDRFIASMDEHGHANVCLPDGLYNTTVNGALSSLPTWIRIPDDTTVSISGFSTAHLQTPPNGIQLHNDDLTSFARSLAEPTLIGMGEANHGTTEFYTYRYKLSLELARIGNLRAIFLEADAMAMLAIDDYVMGATLDLGKAVVALDFWTTDTHEFLAMLNELRAYNSTVPLADKVHILGVDAQDISLPSKFLLDHHSEIGASAREAELLTKLLSDNGKAFTTMSDSDHASLYALLDRLALPAHSSDLVAIRTRASIAARSLRLQLGYFSKPGVDGLRDPAMAELTQHLLALTGVKQAALWAHNAHISRIGRDGARSLGECLAEQFGSRYYPVAFFAYRGIARAWDSAGKIGVIPHELSSPPPYNLESVIMQATGMQKVAWIRLAQSDPAWQRWLTVPRYVREFGAAYTLDEIQNLRTFPNEFLAAVVIDHTTPTTPTRTGVRKVP